MSRFRFPSRLILILAGLTALGCGKRVDEQAARSEAAQSGEFAAEFMAADRQFAAEVAAAQPGERSRIWAAWFTAEGRQLVPGQVVQGPVAITGLMDPAFGTPGYSLQWEPDQALVSSAGDLGWTSGRYVSTRAGAGGPLTTEGRYLTIWRRGPDGWLKVELDTGVPD